MGTSATRVCSCRRLPRPRRRTDRHLVASPTTSPSHPRSGSFSAARIKLACDRRSQGNDRDSPIPKYSATISPPDGSTTAEPPPTAKRATSSDPGCPPSNTAHRTRAAPMLPPVAAGPAASASNPSRSSSLAHWSISSSFKMLSPPTASRHQSCASTVPVVQGSAEAHEQTVDKASAADRAHPLPRTDAAEPTCSPGVASGICCRGRSQTMSNSYVAACSVRGLVPRSPSAA